MPKKKPVRLRWRQSGYGYELHASDRAEWLAKVSPKRPNPSSPTSGFYWYGNIPGHLANTAHRPVANAAAAQAEAEAWVRSRMDEPDHG